jgi:hypothetical protein
MLKPRFLTSTLMHFFLLTYSLSAFAQLNRNSGQWVDDLFLVRDNFSFYLIDENNVIKQKIPFANDDLTESTVPRRFRVRQSNSVWYNDGLNMIVSGSSFSSSPEKDADGSFRTHTFTKWQNGNWDVLGSFKIYDDPRNRLHINNGLNFIPCNNDRFIVISSFTDLTGNTGKDITPFTRVSLNSEKGEIKIISSITRGQDELGEQVSMDDFFNIVHSSEVIITDNYATLLNYSTGHYWIFSLEKASLVKYGNILKHSILKSILENIPKNFNTIHMALAVITAHPEKDGTILISTRDESAIDAEINYVNETNEMALKMADKTITGKEYQDWREKSWEKMGEQYPWIEWYRIYPETGKAEKILPPEGAAIDRDGNKNDIWRPMPDGSVQMGVKMLKEQEPEKAKQEPEKEEAITK